MRRPTGVTYPDTGGTTYCYTDEGGPTCTASGPPYSVVTTEKMSPSQNLMTTDFFDGLGRPSEHQLNSDPDCASGDRTDTTYDALGRAYTLSNPYCTTSDPTYGITTYTYDALGRTIRVTKPDNSIATTSYTGRATEATDESGKQRISQVDGLGRLTTVCEVTAADLPVGISGSTTPAPCGLDIGATGFFTTYVYDGLDDLKSVTQGPLNLRSFTYNSLGQLTSATNPESGQTSYTYDANGNLATKTAPAPNQTGSATVTTTYTYDALNRLTEKSYSDGTTLSTLYGYDTTQITMGSQQFTIANTTGRLSWNCVLTSTGHCNPMTAYSYL